MKVLIQEIFTINGAYNVDRYESPNSRDIFARIPIQPDPTRPFGSLLYINNIIGKYTRTYFGPVDLKKFSIKLLNDKGFIVDLNGLDWSFSMTVTQLQATMVDEKEREYIRNVESDQLKLQKLTTR